MKKILKWLAVLWSSLEFVKAHRAKKYAKGLTGETRSLAIKLHQFLNINGCVEHYHILSDFHLSEYCRFHYKIHLELWNHKDTQRHTLEYLNSITDLVETIWTGSCGGLTEAEMLENGRPQWSIDILKNDHIYEGAIEHKKRYYTEIKVEGYNEHCDITVALRKRRDSEMKPYTRPQLF